MNSYLDVFIGEYSAKAVLAELARCLSLFPNLHTVQIDVDQECRLHLEEIFEQAFEKYSYPQIRNVFIMFSSISFVASCPQARCIGFKKTRNCSMSAPLCLQSILDKCPYLEELGDTRDVSWSSYTCNRAYLISSLH